MNCIKLSVFLALLSVLSCQNKSYRNLSQIKKTKSLKVLTLNGPTTLYENKEEVSHGYEYELANKLAKHLGVTAEFIVKDTTNELFRSLEEGEGDIIAAGITKTPARMKSFFLTKDYQTVEELLICHKSVKAKLGQIPKEKLITVERESSYEETLKDLTNKGKIISKWESIPKTSTPQLLKEISEEKRDCTIADGHLLNIYKRFIPNLKNISSIAQKRTFSWVVHKDNNTLGKSVNQWFEDEGIAFARKLEGDYYGYLKNFDPYDLYTFKKRIKSRLPKYKKVIQEMSEKHGWDWRLIAAISYQESHWNPKAKSPTGVRGFMMLTLNTAKSLGVSNRLDPKQSLEGGTRYLRKLYKRLPAFISKRDREWMMLASYNIGFSHLRDARALAVWQKKNPNSWNGVKDALPLLSQKKYYKKLPHGYARGLEPILYVKRIKEYYNILNGLDTI